MIEAAGAVCLNNPWSDWQSDFVIRMDVALRRPDHVAAKSVSVEDKPTLNRETGNFITELKADIERGRAVLTNDRWNIFHNIRLKEGE